MNRPDGQFLFHNAVASSAFRHFHPLSRLKNLFSRMTGNPVESGLGEYWKMVEIVKAINLSGKTDSQLAERSLQIAHLLRDQIAYDRDSLVHRRFNFALVDEADSILIDEDRIPLVISGAEDRASWDTNRLASIVRVLIPDRDFETDR